MSSKIGKCFFLPKKHPLDLNNGKQNSAWSHTDNDEMQNGKVEIECNLIFSDSCVLCLGEVTGGADRPLL